MRLVAFDETLYRELQDDEFAQAYLQDALDESFEEFLIALGKFIRARSGMSHYARVTGLSREALYKMFQPGANPTVQSIERILRAAGFGLRLEWQGAPEGHRPAAHVPVPSFLYDNVRQLAEVQGVSPESLAQCLLSKGVAELERGITKLSSGTLAGEVTPRPSWRFETNLPRDVEIPETGQVRERSRDIWQVVGRN